MTQCNTKTRLDFHQKFPIDIEFSADDISSDGGVVLLRQAEERLGVCRQIAGLVPDERDPNRVVHSRYEQVLQRVFQIALGYADQNDADHLRGDPLLKAACDLAPAENPLSSQPTLSRLENSVDPVHVEAMQWRLFLSWIDSLDDDRREITLDIDSSAFEGHGQQQNLSFNTYHGGHILHPLLLFDDETGELITAILRPGNAHDSTEAADWLERIIVALKVLHRRDCSVVVRADAGFASPATYRRLEQLDDIYGEVGYLIGLRGNSVLADAIEPALKSARKLCKRCHQPARIFVDFAYQAGSWNRSRHVIGKAEVTLLGDNPRFVVTNLDEFPPRLLYEMAYCGRGRCEQHIGEFKGGLEGDRISCHLFEANGFRLILAALAYRLLFELRRTIAAEADATPGADTDKTKTADLGGQLQGLARASFQTLRLRLLKVAVIVRQSVRRLYLQGARSFPMAEVFHHVARAMA